MTRISKAGFHQALSELAALGGEADLASRVELRARTTSLDTPFKAGEAASAALAAGAAIAGSLNGRRRSRFSNDIAQVSVDSRHAESSLLSFAHLHFADPDKGLTPRVAGEDRTAAAGFYPTADERWIYLHSGFPHNTQGLLDLLDVADNRPAVSAAVANRTAADLEAAIAAAGLCGAALRSADEWDASSAGSLLGSRPVVEIIQMGDSAPEPPPADGTAPLDGIRVLDLTRILAGPTCARTLASYGADVLRVGADHLPVVPLFVADTGFGKRACHLDLRTPSDQATLRGLLGQADVFSQGYRSGAMERLGFGVNDVISARPGMVYVSINCYGHEGEWRPRPGWEQLAQTVTGMAHTQGEHLGLGKPSLLPAAVNDYITGYLAAFGALVALKRRAELGGSYWVRVSLARTAMWVRALGLRRSVNAKPVSRAEIRTMSQETDSNWGPLSYLRPAVTLSNTEVGWNRPPVPVGTDPASF